MNCPCSTDPCFCKTVDRMVLDNPCRRCGERPSTGYFVHLCDPCFDEFEERTKGVEHASDEEKAAMRLEVDQWLNPEHRSGQ